ncbi:nucleoside recognition domain-containing protein [Agrobacterium tumefaciens]|uniref:nucleoside recognition domain-containing protein n=1 Tax=Agrobacterium tumefaciens TaxID=358 RepID=UPI00157470DE|nr:nucleoside recognition domain-containing protein [Agrobacterium tumefaciens]NSZ62115.1 nucleoside recognition protein [Agrobacterium tumefaciens]NTA68487.1 nucleoside recognition protein [Agrobacterium tumefaciens]WIE38319.1 nucleoside recognition domain-containing protein [Agrobacterium tumefaciens]
MPFLMPVWRKTLETLEIYWVLVRITVPIAILTEILSRMGAIEAVAPAFAPVMNLIGLPPELGLAWLTGMLVGIWGAVPLVFTLVPVSSLDVADITVFSALILFAHGLPIEQKIIEKAGPGIVATTLLRIIGGLLYAFLLHHLLEATGWLSAPVNPAWNAMSATPDWVDYFWGLGETMLFMLVILLALSFGLEILKLTGLMKLMMKALSPVLRLAGIRGEAEHLTAIGLFLGISYGAGLLIREARSGTISARQVFLSCVFMGFAHSVIEDTIVVMSLGADIYGVLAGRLVFAIAATAVIAALIHRLSNKAFFARMFRLQGT